MQELKDAIDRLNRAISALEKRRIHQRRSNPCRLRDPQPNRARIPADHVRAEYRQSLAAKRELLHHRSRRYVGKQYCNLGSRSG